MRRNYQLAAICRKFRKTQQWAALPFFGTPNAKTLLAPMFKGSGRGKIPVIEGLCGVLGLMAILYCAFYWLRLSYIQLQGNRWLSSPAAREKVLPHPGDFIARISIPSRSLSAAVIEGTDEASLARGVGHLPLSVLPGYSGNVVLAAHRDTMFRNLEYVQPGDIIQLTTPARTIEYTVRSAKIVSADSTYVAHPSSISMITLITCYPFDYIGNAPQRYVVQGVLAANAGTNKVAVASKAATHHR